MKKKLIAALSAVCMALAFCPMAFADLAPLPEPETGATSFVLVIAIVVIAAAIAGISIVRKMRRK